MTAEDQDPASEGTTVPAGEDELSGGITPTQPALNRAERRAQAKGKKGGAGGAGGSLPHGQNSRAFGGRTTGFGKSNIPRTGHK